MNELMQPIHPAYAALLSGKRPEPCEPFVEVSSKALARLLDVVEFGDQLERVEKDNLLASMKELLAQEQPELWVIHSVGPGELHPMISKEAADSQAAEMAEMFKEHVGKLGLRFDVIRSPFTPLEHFEILAEELTDHRDNLLGHCKALEKKLAETAAPAVVNQQLTTAASLPVVVPEGCEDWSIFAGYLIDKCEGCEVSEESVQYWLGEMLADPHYGALFRREKQPHGMPSAIELAIESAEEEHGGLRAAAKAIGVDAGYLSRLKSGEKLNPGDDVLAALGLERVVTYRTSTAAPTVKAEQVPTPEFVWVRLLDALAGDNGCSFSASTDDYREACQPLVDLIAAGFFRDSADSLDGDIWTVAAGEQGEAAARFASCADAYAVLSSVLNRVFERDDQAYDRNAERLTAEALGTGSGINMAATSIDELFDEAPSLLVAGWADLTAVRCQCCAKEYPHDSYDAGFIAGSGMCQMCDAAMPPKDLPAAGSVVEEVEVVGYRFFHVDHGYIFRRAHIYEGNPSLEAHSLMTVAQHERIVAELQRELKFEQFTHETCFQDLEKLRAAPAAQLAAEPDCDRSACGDFSPGPCDNPDCTARRDKPAALLPSAEPVTSREDSMVVLECDGHGTPKVWCDPEIADLVGALNSSGIRTVASCSGHGVRPGVIALADRRELIIAADYETARLVEGYFQGINGESPRNSVPAGHSVEPVSQKYDDVLLPFLSMMRAELHANTGKGDRPGWLAMSPEQCLLEIYYHTAKLQKAVKNNDMKGVREYTADVANMSMMLADNCGWLDVVSAELASGEQKPMAELISQHRIAITPEHEGQWHADLYGSEAEPLARAEGATPEAAVAAVVALFQSLQEQQP